MSDAHAEAAAIESRWAGGVRPYAMGSKKLGMWLFIISDALTFSALIMAYSYVRISSAQWPTPFPFSPAIIFSTVMTFALLSSSLTMVMAVAAAHRHDHRKAVLWLLATMACGTAFVVLHMMEWSHLINEGLRPWATPAEWPWPNTPLFGSTFFGLTGMHMLHVTIGIIYLGVIAFGFGKKKFEAEDVEVSGLYWHFVDLVWMFIFPLIYLMSIKF
ncbi:MAG TPA: cytochrome c oxidase subunit 3 [Candidatus Acidoferrales bacterium]|nr:cytochrome c oxidase subunit 3 [Candidatus Acidoferrales bacterium]